MAGDAVAQFRLQISWSSEYINSTYNAPRRAKSGYRLADQPNYCRAGNKEKLLPLGRALDRVLTWNSLHAAM